MTEKNKWEMFFDEHAPIYNENEFTSNTLKEVDFLIEELSLPKGATILDIGCGTGRHSVELAKHGYDVTGLDLSSKMLKMARKAADKAGVRVEWIHADASNFSLPKQFDAVIGICEGGCGLLGQSDDPIEQPLAILRNVAKCLKPEGKAIFTVLNAMKMIRMYGSDDIAVGRFNPITFVESSELRPREGLEAISTRERGFVPTELTLMFRLAGMSVISIWGGTAGNWCRWQIDLDEFEIMVVAKKDSE